MSQKPNFSADPYFRAAEFGIELQHFISAHGKIGRYLWERADAHRVEALEKLATVDPTDTKEIVRLQHEFQIPKLFYDWIEQGIQEGLAAEATIEVQESSGN